MHVSLNKGQKVKGQGHLQVRFDFNSYVAKSYMAVLVVQSILLARFLSYTAVKSSK